MLFAAVQMSLPGTSRTSGDVRIESTEWAKADNDQVAVTNPERTAFSNNLCSLRVFLRLTRSGLAGHSAFAPANLTTLAHFSASSGRPYRSCSPSTARSLNTDYQRLDLPVAGFCFRFSDYHKPSAVALAVAEGGRMARPAHNSFALARCGAGTPPAFDLALVLLWHAATHVVTAIPLEPAARIVRVDPSFVSPL
jgi:hypothetical protein